MTETEARKAFNAARGELQAALATYQTARAQLHRVTGKFVGTDPALSLQFSSACAGLQAGEAHPFQAKADC